MSRKGKVATLSMLGPKEALCSGEVHTPTVQSNMFMASLKYLEYVKVTMETITIPKAEYTRLKKLEELDFDLIRQFAAVLKI